MVTKSTINDYYLYGTGNRKYNDNYNAEIVLWNEKKKKFDDEQGDKKKLYREWQVNMSNNMVVHCESCGYAHNKYIVPILPKNIHTPVFQNTEAFA